MTYRSFAVAIALLFVSTGVTLTARAECTQLFARAGESFFGELENDDCLTGLNTLGDAITFTPTSNRVYRFTLRPIDPAFKDPVLGVFPPGNGAISEPVVISGGETLEIVLPAVVTSGWTVIVSSESATSSGRYVVRIDDEGTAPSSRPTCLFQYLGCGQKMQSSLLPSSCKFGSADRLYVAVDTDELMRGDVVTANLKSFQFDPLVALYDSDRNVVATGRTTFSENELSFRLKKTDYYTVLATSAEDGQAGDFDLEFQCSTPQCLWPIVTQHPQAKAVIEGDTVNLSVEASVSEPATYEWFSTLDPFAPTATGKVFQSAPLDRSVGFFVRISNSCGIVTSDTAQVSVEAKRTRRRPARRGD